MTIEQIKVVDVISIDPSTDEVVMTISDHLDWTDPDEHLLLLQEKLNSYLAFIESGELLRSYPKAKGKAVLIDVVFKFPLVQGAIEFIEKATLIFGDAGFTLSARVFED